MKLRHAIGVAAAIVVTATAAWQCAARVRDSDAVPSLTADIRRRLNLPPREGRFPQSSLSEALAGVTRPDSVARRLAPLAPLVRSTRWVHGNQFVAQILDLQLTTGGVFAIALVYDGKSERLVDIDTPEYLGETEVVQSPSEIAKYPAPGST
jgi:hypothetical protein